MTKNHGPDTETAMYDPGTPTDHEVASYHRQRRRLRAMRRQLADHPHPLDPDHPAFYDEDVDALERELDEAFS